MMSEGNKSEFDLMDEYYGETNSENIRSSREYLEFSERMNKASERLQILEKDLFNFDIDTLGIIQRADRIRDARRGKRELAAFLLSGAAILGGYGLLTIIYGARFLLVTQIVMASLIPWTLVPVAYLRKGKEW